jgi:hypothetical protein
VEKKEKKKERERGCSLANTSKKKQRNGRGPLFFHSIFGDISQ